MQSYKELEVWQKGVELVEIAYKLVGQLPSSERFGLTSQIQRAAVSVPANIAEGWARGTTKEFIQFLRIARGSTMELETHFIVAVRLKLISAQSTHELNNAVESVGMMLNRLIHRLTQRLK